MENLFKVAKQNRLIADIAKELEGLWQDHGRPEEPDGPNTSFRSTVPAWLDEQDLDDMAEMSEEEKEIQIARYNGALEALLELTGIWSAGGDQWNTKWECGSTEWQDYREKSYELVLTFVADVMWDRFCETM